MAVDVWEPIVCVAGYADTASEAVCVLFAHSGGEGSQFGSASVIQACGGHVVGSRA